MKYPMHSTVLSISIYYVYINIPQKEEITISKEEIDDYICITDIATAKSYMKKWLRKYRGNPRIDELNTINHLHDEEVLQKIKQTRAFWRSKPSMKKMKNEINQSFN